VSRSLRQRIERLEGDRGNRGTPSVVVAICPIPATDLPLRLETIDRWLADGVAHIAFGGHAVLYDAGQRPLTVSEWQGKFASTTLLPTQH
jgi:hypothetical protein